ncbi:MAG: GNAT family N-acetyltransferase [Chromatiales bacterium]
MRIRAAVDADIPEIHRVRMSVRENVLLDPDSIGHGDTRDMIGRRGKGWVCEVGGRIVGFAVADRIAANVWALFVEPGYEGRGIGSLLHETMLDWLFESGISTVWLSTDPNTRAECFYQNASWQYVGRESNGEARYEMSREIWQEQ